MIYVSAGVNYNLTFEVGLAQGEVLVCVIECDRLDGPVRWDRGRDGVVNLSRGGRRQLEGRFYEVDGPLVVFPPPADCIGVSVGRHELDRALDVDVELTAGDRQRWQRGDGERRRVTDRGAGQSVFSRAEAVTHWTPPGGSIGVEALGFLQTGRRASEASYRSVGLRNGSRRCTRWRRGTVFLTRVRMPRVVRW